MVRGKSGGSGGKGRREKGGRGMKEMRGEGRDMAPKLPLNQDPS